MEEMDIMEETFTPLEANPDIVIAIKVNGLTDYRIDELASHCYGAAAEVVQAISEFTEVDSDQLWSIDYHGRRALRYLEENNEGKYFGD